MNDTPLTEAEARRRLGEAYAIILRAAAKRRAQQAADQAQTTTTTEADRV